jgi:hypothetical protein
VLQVSRYGIDSLQNCFAIQILSTQHFFGLLNYFSSDTLGNDYDSIAIRERIATSPIWIGSPKAVAAHLPTTSTGVKYLQKTGKPKVSINAESQQSPSMIQPCTSL